MVIKNKISMALAIVLMTGVFFLASQSIYAADSCDNPCPDETTECDTFLNEADFTGTQELDEYSLGCHINVLVNPCCQGCLETLKCVGIDLEGSKVWKEQASDEFEIKRSRLGKYNLYFVGPNPKKDFFYTNSVFIKTLLKDKFIQKIEGFKAKDTSKP